MVSVIACTNREEFINNIIHNFQKQKLKDKELVLILNTNKIDFDITNRMLKGMDINYQIFQFSDETSLGECLNKGGEAASYDLVAKMDDDDFYGPGYLQEAYSILSQTDADLVGKSSFYIYFNKTRELRLYNPNHENCWIVNKGDRQYKTEYFLSGATLVFKKKLFNHVSFPAINIGEDSAFQQLCFKNKLKIYSLSKDHYAYIRSEKLSHHTSTIREEILRRRSNFVSNNTTLVDILK